MELYFRQIINAFKKTIEYSEIEEIKDFSRNKIKHISIKFDIQGFYYNYPNNDKYDEVKIPEGQLYFSSLDHDMIIFQNNDFVHSIMVKIFKYFLNNNMYIIDFYFRPIGWLLNKKKPDPVFNNFEILFSTTIEKHDAFILNLIKIFGLINCTSNVEMKQLIEADVKLKKPIFAISSFWPFNPDYSIIIYFFAYYKKTSSKTINFITKEYYFPAIHQISLLSKLYSFTYKLYNIEDKIDKFVIKKLSNSSPIPLTDIGFALGSKLSSFNEVTDFKTSFEEYQVINYKPETSINYNYVKKRFIDILQLPDNIEITCFSVADTTYILKLENKNIYPIFILKKNLNFLKKLNFDGNFIKQNILYKKRYTVKIISNDFICDEFNPKSESKKVLSDSKWKDFIRPYPLDSNFYV